MCCSVSNGTSVTVINVWKEKKNDIWYEVRLSDGKTGWLNAGYVNFNNSNQLEHDLNYTNATAFGSELILWNQAGGNFVAGLFYRRLNEANIYNYGDFKNDRSYLLSNPYGYTFPKSASVLTG
jgi:GH24 family phage-related lysozyme (muramidase)